VGVKEAGAFLTARLSDERRYRERWIQRLNRPRNSTQVDVPAVSKVLAEHLWDTGEVSDTVHDLPRRLRHRVRRALRGEVLSPITLSQLTSAFAFTSEDIGRASELLYGHEPDRVPTTAVLPRRHQERRFRTRATRDHHYIGADRTPIRHRTMQTIESTIDGLSTYPLIFDTAATAVEVVHGGSITHQLTEAPVDGLRGFSIDLDHPLAQSERATLEYVISFEYDSMCEPQFRRVATNRAGSTDLRVEFHPDQLPRAVWWCYWLSLGGPIGVREQVELSPDHAVQRWLPFMDHACLGFLWEW
jgi:hypothetical protein